MKRLFYFFTLVLFYPALSWADCVLLPITGNGSDASPYRPNFPVGMNKIPGFKWAASIPSKPDGSPQYPDTHVCFPVGFKFPPGLTALPPAQAVSEILKRDPNANLKALTPPPAVIKSSWRDYGARTYRLAKKHFGIAKAWAASATDSFAGTGALSANWSSGYASESAPTRVSDAAECAIGVRCVASYNALVPTNDQYAQATVIQISGSVDTDLGVAVRMTAPTTFTGFFVRCGYLSDGTTINFTTIQKRVSGSASILAADAVTQWNTSDLIRVEIIGSGLEVKLNGVSLLTTSDTAPLLTSGRAGVMLNSANSTTSGDNARLDNFEVGDLGAAPATTRRRVVVVQ